MSEFENFIEDVGLHYESVGLPRMAGRILGYLLASAGDSAGFDELVEKLQASKGSISGNLQLLIGRRLISKRMKPGDRRSYYQLSLTDLSAILDAKINAFGQVKAIMQRANVLNAAHHLEKHQQIAKLIAFYSFMERELPQLQEKWERSWQATEP